MDDKQQQFIQDIAGLALLVLQAIFHGQSLFNSTPSNSPVMQDTHAAVINAKQGLAAMVQTAQQ